MVNLIADFNQKLNSDYIPEKCMFFCSVMLYSANKVLSQVQSGTNLKSK